MKNKVPYCSVGETQPLCIMVFLILYGKWSQSAGKPGNIHLHFAWMGWRNLRIKAVDMNYHNINQQSLTQCSVVMQFPHQWKHNNKDLYSHHHMMNQISSNMISKIMPPITHPLVLLLSYILIMTSLNGNIFRVTGPLCGEFTGLRWIPRTKASDAELWCFLRSAPE